MGYETIIVEKEGYITTVTLNRSQKLNAISNQLLKELQSLLCWSRYDY